MKKSAQNVAKLHQIAHQFEKGYLISEFITLLSRACLSLSSNKIFTYKSVEEIMTSFPEQNKCFCLLESP